MDAFIISLMSKRATYAAAAVIAFGFIIGVVTGLIHVTP